MSQMLEDCDGVVCHADDILVHGKDNQERDTRLHQVLKRLEAEGLTLNDKCEFSRDSIMFVGHHVSADGVAPDPGKIKAIRDMPALLTYRATPLENGYTPAQLLMG